MHYKGYAARIEYDADDQIFVGHVLGIRDIVSFHGTTVDEMETAFRESVDDYLAACKQWGQEPDRPFSGKLTLRISPELHARAAISAQLAGKSTNQWIADLLEQAQH